MAENSKQSKNPSEASQARTAKAERVVSGKLSGIHWPTLFQALVIAVAALWIYWPALRGGWLWDDELLVSGQSIMRDPYGLWKIWLLPGNMPDANFPLKGSVVWLQWQLWGNNTLGYHLTNVVLHIVGAFLVWRLLSKLGLRLAWLGGLIFAIHPVQVESVAWIAELKNTLSLPFFLLAICAWIDYEEHKKSRDYFFALGLFLAAMLCKPTMVMFPVVILLYAWWKKGQIEWNDLKITVPFLVVSLALGLMTVCFLQRHALGNVSVQLGGFFSRFACAGLSLSFYFSKCFLPVGLMPIYPRWVVDPPVLSQFLPWPVFAVVMSWFWIKRESWGRHALLGLGFFVINLAPFVGFSAASYMDFTWVMDHVLYIPIIGLIGLVVAVLGEMEKQPRVLFRFCGIGMVSVTLAWMAFESRGYAALYINQETLWTYELGHNPEAWLAHHNLGVALFEKGRVPEAIVQYEEALRINPDYAEAHNSLGLALFQMGQTQKATEQYEEALQIEPDDVEARNNLGNVLLQQGRMTDAFAQYEEAVRIDPDNAESHYNAGNVLLEGGRLTEAMEQFDLALKIRPDFAEAHNGMGNALCQTGQLTEATTQFEEALRLKPDFAEACYNLANVLKQTGRIPEAITQYEQALRLKPGFADAHNNLGLVLLQTDQLTAAVEQFEQSLSIKPDDAGTRYNLGYTLQQAGRTEDAREQYEQALRIDPNLAAARNNLAQLQSLEKTVPVKK